MQKKYGNYFIIRFIFSTFVCSKPFITMRKSILLLLAVFLLGSVNATAQEKKFSLYAVGFYNQENLFDTIHDAGKNDFDFLPTGSYKWNTLKYTHKLRNMARALADMGTDKTPLGCALIGLSEVENDNVLNDLVAQEPLASRNMQYKHIEGPDKRGVDCALIYNPKQFQPYNTFVKQYVYENGDTTHFTRPFLTVQGLLGGDKLTVIVCHWPSRSAESKFREWGGKQVRALTDSIAAAEPDMKILVMGDMNDDPDNPSMAKCLGARREMKDVAEGDFYNPWWNILRKENRGTLAYNGAWNLFDQIVMSKNLLAGDKEKEYKKDVLSNCETLRYYQNNIFQRDYLMQTEGKYKLAPKRTTAGGVWLDGFSDHLPVVVYLIKEQK